MNEEFLKFYQKEFLPLFILRTQPVLCNDCLEKEVFLTLEKRNYILTDRFSVLLYKFFLKCTYQTRKEVEMQLELKTRKIFYPDTYCQSCIQKEFDKLSMLDFKFDENEFILSCVDTL